MTVTDRRYPLSWHLPLWGACFGLLAGFIELVMMAVDREFFGRILFFNWHVIWMAPLAEGLLGAAIGLGVWGVTRVIPRLPVSFAAWACTIAPAFGVLIYLHPRLHAVAGLIVAAGISVQVGRFAAARLDRFDRLVRRALPWCAALLVVLTGTAFGYDAWRVRQETVKLGATVPASPNVLLIVLDTVRAKSLSLYGHGRPTTPQLEAFARTGVRFDMALSTASWTAPAHGSMFTGLYAGTLNVGWRNPLAEDFLTMAESLRDRGYETAAFVGNTVGCTFERGLDQGFLQYRDYPMSLGQLARSSALIRGVFDIHRFRRVLGWYEALGRKSAPDVTAQFVSWLDRKTPRPYYAFLNYFDAHDPYVPPKPYDTMFGPNPRNNPWMAKRWWHPPTPGDTAAELKAYEGAIAYLDHEIGKLFDELRRRGQLDNTLVIITSDHGEEFAEHGGMGHGRSLFGEIVHVPLVVSFPPAVPAGAVVTPPVTIRDIPATIDGLLGGTGTPYAGRSLARYWGPTPEPGEPVIAQGDKMFAVIHEGWHYYRDARGRDFLYRTATDRDQQHNLAGTPEGQATIARLRELGQAIESRDLTLKPAGVR